MFFHKLAKLFTSTFLFSAAFSHLSKKAEKKGKKFYREIEEIIIKID